MPSNQTGNKHFCLQLFRFSINVADLFVFAGTNWEHLVPKCYRYSLSLILWFYFCNEFLSSPIGIAYLHIKYSINKYSINKNNLRIYLRYSFPFFWSRDLNGFITSFLILHILIHSDYNREGCIPNLQFDFINGALKKDFQTKKLQCRKTFFSHFLHNNRTISISFLL